MTTTVNNSANSVIIVKAFDFGKIKNAYKDSKTVFNKVTKIQEKMEKLQSELEAQNVLLEALSAYTKLITNGMTPQELVTEVEEVTEKLDKNGNPIKVYKYIPKEGVVTFNEEKKYYEIKKNPVELEENLSTQNPPMIDESAIAEVIEVAPETTPINVDAFSEKGNDFDVDAKGDVFGDAKENSENNPFFN